MAGLAEGRRGALRDADGRAETVETESDAKVKRVKARLKFSYDEPTRSLGPAQGRRQGAARLVDAEDLGEGRTRATYGLDVDPGRMLGMLLRGPIEGQVRDFLLGGAAEGLKKQAEKG